MCGGALVMPAVASGGGGGHGGGGAHADELGSSDEVKVFKDEGEDENEANASESLQAELLEEKSSLITESEQGKGELRRHELGPHFAVPGFSNPFGMGYLVNPYAAYANGAAQLGRGGSPLSPFLSDPLGSPPPAHMGSLPYSLDKPGMPPLRPPLYSFPPQYPYSMLGAEQLAAWHQASMYQSRSSSPYSIPITSSSHISPMSRFSPGGGLLPPSHPGLPFPHGLPHHLPHIKQEYDRPPHLIPHNDMDRDNNHNSSPKKGKEPHIKKPLNAFMLYMKEMRPVVQAECTLKESAAINQILGRRWHGLSREEQAKYYEKARQARQVHMQMYPHWNARDNYRFGQKKKKRKRDKSDDPAANMKKCRARYGLDQQNLWCKPCRRKKKCIRVQMYLAGRTEQEIEATTFDEEGEALGPLAGQVLVPQPNLNGVNVGGHQGSNGSGSSINSDGEGGSPASVGGSVESSEHSVTSPATPGGGLSLPSLGSPSSIASPSTPGGSHDPDSWFRNPVFRPPTHRPVGNDPRDSKNPLSISQLTSNCHSREQNGHGSRDKPILGVT